MDIGIIAANKSIIFFIMAITATSLVLSRTTCGRSLRRMNLIDVPALFFLERTIDLRELHHSACHALVFCQQCSLIFRKGYREKMQANIERILEHLEGDNASDVAGSALALSIVLQQTPPGSLPPLPGTSAKLISLLSSQNFSVKNNALVALSAAIEASNDIARAALADGAVKELVGVLSSTSDPMSAEEESLCINAMGALGSLGEALPDGLNDMMESGALHQIVELSSPDASSSLVESAVDTMCKLMSHGFGAVEAAKEAGAIPALGTLLSHDIGDEIIVRVLIGLGMLLKGGDACCLALASTDGAVGGLLRLTRQSRDSDIQLIAGEIFRQLGKCEASKEAVLQAVREAHAFAQGPQVMDKKKRGGSA